MSEVTEALLSVAIWSPPKIKEVLVLLPGGLHFCRDSIFQNCCQVGTRDSDKDWVNRSKD